MNRRTKRRFWVARVVFIALQAPLILFLQWRYPDVLLSYLVWMSWATWLSADLPTGAE